MVKATEREPTAELFDVECQRCHKRWDSAILEAWGTDAFPETMGYGPKPMCVAIVTNRRGNAGEVCAGDFRIVAKLA